MERLSEGEKKEKGREESGWEEEISRKRDEETGQPIAKHMPQLNLVSHTL